MAAMVTQVAENDMHHFSGHCYIQGHIHMNQDIATYIEDQSTVYGMIFHGYSNGDWRTNPLDGGSRQGFNALSADIRA